MASFNKCILLGNLTRDIELRYTAKGTAVVKFTLALNHKYEANGEKREEVSFVDVESWGKQAEVLAQYIKKGNPLLVEGRLKQESWEDKQSGQKKTKLKVVLESFTFIGSGNGQRQASEPQKRAEAPQPDAPGDAPPPDDSDVPF